MTGKTVGGTTDPKVNPVDPKFPKSLDAGSNRGATNDGVFNDNDVLTLEEFLDGVELNANAKIPHALGWLNKCPPHIMVTDHSHFKWYAGYFGISQGRISSGIRKRHDQVCLDRSLMRQLTAMGLSGEIDVLAENGAVRSGEIDKFKYAKGPAGSSRRLQTLNAIISDVMISPGFSSRMNSASTRSSAQVSEAST